VHPVISPTLCFRSASFATNYSKWACHIASLMWIQTSKASPYSLKTIFSKQYCPIILPRLNIYLHTHFQLKGLTSRELLSLQQQHTLPPAASKSTFGWVTALQEEKRQYYHVYFGEETKKNKPYNIHTYIKR